MRTAAGACGAAAARPTGHHKSHFDLSGATATPPKGIATTAAHHGHATAAAEIDHAAAHHAGNAEGECAHQRGGIEAATGGRTARDGAIHQERIG